MNNDNRTPSYRHILKYTSLFGSVQGLTVLLGVLRNKIVTMLLGAEGMGLSALFSSTIKLVSDATNFGLGISAVKHVSSYYDSGDDAAIRRAIMLIRGWSLLAGVFGMAVCMALSPLLNRITFAWGDHTFHFVCLSIVVFMTAITSGEIAILKGTRRLTQLVRVSVYTVVGSILATTPLFYYLGMSGVVPSLIIVALIQMLLTISFSYRYYRLQIVLSRELLGEGYEMVRLGLVFVFAGVLASASDFIIRSYFTRNVGLGLTGLYNSGYALVFSYGAMVFSSMDSEYYPRLSGIKNLGASLNEAVNRQIEVSLLVVGPMTTMMVVGMPILIPLLFRVEFLEMLGMTQIATLGLILRAVYLPMEYLSLSRGDAKTFFIQELFACAMLVVGVLAGYRLGGLTGIGLGITAGALVETLFVMAYSRRKYGYLPDPRLYGLMGMLTLIALLTLACTRVENPYLYWACGVAVSMFSIGYSWRILRMETK